MNVHPQLTRRIQRIFASSYLTHGKNNRVERTRRTPPLTGNCVLDHVKSKRTDCCITRPYQQRNEELDQSASLKLVSLPWKRKET
jgi:hypothetical protein